MSVKAMKFYSRFNNRPETLVCPTGDGFQNEYALTIDKETNKEILVKTGKTNLYAKIQEHLEETLIENILARATIDPTVLAAKQEEFWDATAAPRSLMEAQVTILNLKNEFEKLPADVKREFDFSMEKYVAEYGSAKWAKALGLTKEEAAEMKIEEQMITTPDSGKGEEVNAE